MKRSWNGFLWAGFVVVVAAVLSYFFFFLRFPVTRDIPWVTFLLFLVAAWLLVAGLQRAFGQPESYRGKISGPILSALSLIIAGLFCYLTFSLGKDLPSADKALRAGQQAPDFILSDAGGKAVALSELLKKNRAVVLIFYRGYW